MRLRFEDFTPGRVFDLGEFTLSEDDITAFAREWDPQQMHLDPRAAAGGQFGGLIASGWQTACVWMRMYVDTVLRHADMFAAPGVEELRWWKPVRPHMVLKGRATILDGWPSERDPERGTICLLGELFDEQGEQVMTMRARGHARRREEVQR
jgi:acyl dehydratase